jgi:hypothetical protein
VDLQNSSEKSEAVIRKGEDEFGVIGPLKCAASHSGEELNNTTEALRSYRRFRVRGSKLTPLNTEQEY